jgi:hypothetical protein
MPKKTFPTFFPPMMAEIAKARFGSPDWIFELKLDGYLAIAGKGERQPPTGCRCPIAYACSCCSSTKQSTSNANVMSMRTARTSSSVIASRREACAHTFQSRVSGSLIELTRLRFVRRVVKAGFRSSAASNRVVPGVNGMIVVGIATSRFSVSSWSAGP